MKFYTLCLLSVLAALTGCASQQDVFILRDRIVALEQRNMDLQQRTVASEKDKDQMKTRVERVLEEKDMEIKSQSAGLQARLDKMSSDIQMLGGKIDETAYALNQRINAMEEAEKRKEVRPPSGAPDADPGTRPTMPTPTRPGPSAGTQPDRNALSDEELYNFAKEAFDKSDFEAARDGFQKLVKNYPRSKWADSAQFWVGESYFRQKWYEKAILEYQSVIEKYPKGNKVKAALLKQGLSFMELGDKANGRLILQELVQKYPNSEEARTAKQRLR
jgi:tol-pal system protein YbgF